MSASRWIKCKFELWDEQCGDMGKLRFEDGEDFDFDGKYLQWKLKNGEVREARMKQDAYDHFYPRPEPNFSESDVCEVLIDETVQPSADVSLVLNRATGNYEWKHIRVN